MNPFFGRIGDVWKHLLLMEVIDSYKPAYYLESHAGSAFYPLSHSPDRDFGVYAFVAAASSHPVLKESVYNRLLHALPTDEAGYPDRYPGSSALVMMLLGASAKYTLWDVDGESTRSLTQTASTLGLSDDVRVLETDGLDGVDEETRTLADVEGARGLIFIDPFDPFEPSTRHNRNAIEVVRDVAERGLPVVYWYGLDDEGERGWMWQALLGPSGGTSHSWGGEIGPGRADAPGLFEDGMRGCGLICLNSASAIPSVRAAAEAMVDAYRDLRPAHSNVAGFRYEEFT